MRVAPDMYAHFHASTSCHATCLGQGQEDGANPQDCRFGGPSLFRSSALQVLIYARTYANNEETRTASEAWTLEFACAFVHLGNARIHAHRTTHLDARAHARI